MVKVERLSENRVKLVVTVSAEQFDLALDAAFNKVVKDVKVDGFRPGKLPKHPKLLSASPGTVECAGVGNDLAHPHPAQLCL